MEKYNKMDTDLIGTVADPMQRADIRIWEGSDGAVQKVVEPTIEKLGIGRRPLGESIWRRGGAWGMPEGQLLPKVPSARPRSRPLCPFRPGLHDHSPPRPTRGGSSGATRRTLGHGQAHP